MTTPLRLEVPGGIYHLTTRGDNQEPIFHDDADRRAFVWMLGHVARKYRWTGLAYCLMGNHYHLLIQTPFGGLSSGMDVLNGGYARRRTSGTGAPDTSSVAASIRASSPTRATSSRPPATSC